MEYPKYAVSKNDKGIGNEPYQGWSNAATWSANLLFLQERKNYELFLDLAKQKKLTPTRARKEMLKANFQVDDGFNDGKVNCYEIVEDFLSNFRE